MSERNIDLNSVLFHGLESIHNIQREQRALEKLECILQSGAILSRSGQLSQLDLNTHEFLNEYFYNKFSANWNGSEYISICKKAIGGIDSLSYRTYVGGNNGVGIALSEDVLTLVDSNRRLLMDGEFQVKDAIPLDHMVAIVCGGKSFKELNSDIEYYGRELCLTNCEIKKQLSLIQSARWVGFHNSIGELLYKYGYDDIPIISSQDGFEIGNVKDVMDEMGL